MLEHWLLDPDVSYLNHGTVGAIPKRVLARQQALRDHIERAPAQVLVREVAPLFGLAAREGPSLRGAAGEVAAFLGVEGNDLVFVDNATAGIVSVLGSLAFEPGDEIAITDHTYGAVANVAAFIARRFGAVVRAAELPFPCPGPDALAAAVETILSERTRVIVADHVTSDSALVMPVAEIARLARARGIPVLVDGAHAPGAIPVDIAALGVDWYTANMHKWAMAPRSCGVLWAKPSRQEGLHPPVVSWGLDQGMIAEFDWVGTRDLTPYLAAPEGIAFMRDLGLQAMQDHNHALVLEAAELLSRHWRSERAAVPALTGTMATVALPEGLGGTPEEGARLRDALLSEDAIEAHIASRDDRLWVRISAQIYNELGEYERLAAVVAARS